MPRSRSFRTLRRWTAVEARAALAAHASSGLSQNAFASREGLDPQRLSLWRRKLGVALSVPSFVEVRPRDIAHIEIVLLSGVILRVRESVDAVALRRIVDALDGSPC